MSHNRPGRGEPIDGVRWIGSSAASAASNMRPKKLQQLQRHLKSLLGRDATDESVQGLLGNLLAADALRVTGDSVQYTPVITHP